MSRRNNAASRCNRCRMHSSLCVCALIPTLETRTRLVLVIHRAEDRKPTNTGRLAACAMPNSEIIVRGRAEEPADSIVLRPGTRPLFLFPHEDAVPLASFASDPSAPDDDRPFTLIVPDGNWRQASKVRNRVPGMRDVPCISLPVGEPSIYRLRSEAHPFGLATIEAIGRCLRVLEGDAGPAVERALLHVFRAMVERTLWSRGDFETDEVTGGIPDGVLRHDPRSGTA
jgi:DTW domain-containing protein YfiP